MGRFSFLCILLGLMSGCGEAPSNDSLSPVAVGDCTNSSTSPINVGIDNPPSGASLNDFTVTAAGIQGDKPIIQAGGSTPSMSGINYSGTGLTIDRYQITVNYKNSVLYQGTVNWGVSDCGYSALIDFKNPY